MDPWILKKIQKKEIIIGISTAALALALSISSSFLAMGKIGLEQKKTISLLIVGNLEVCVCLPNDGSIPFRTQDDQL